MEFWGSIFQVRRFSDGRLPWEKWTGSRIFGFFGFGGSQVALSSLSVVLFQFSQWIISQILQFFQSCLRILNSQVCYLLVFFSSHKKHFSNSSVRFGFRLSSVFGFMEACCGHSRQILFPPCLFYFRGYSSRLVQTSGSFWWSRCQRTNREVVSFR